MSNNLTLLDLKKPKSAELTEMDGLVKLVMATMLAVMPFFSQKQESFGILSVYLLIVTLASRIKPRTLLISAASYGIIVLMPYLFGLLMSGLFDLFSAKDLFAYQEPYEIFLRLVRLFLLWYISILYFHSTPMKTVLGLLDKLMTPLKIIGVPVTDYLKVVMCIVLELKETAPEVKKSLEESMRTAIGGGGRKIKINIKGISQILVTLIVNSFEKLDKIESFVEKVNTDDLYNYSFKLSKRDGLAVLSFILLTALVWMVERGALA